MTLEEHQRNLMRYIDNEMNDQERKTFEEHLKTCDTCKVTLQDFSVVKEVTQSMKIADLPEKVWDKYWDKIYNKIERSVAWFLFITGALILTGYSIYNAVTDPGLYSLVGLGIVLTLVGFAILFISVLREKLTVNKNDRYISEVKR
ncbi:anti-sigma factor family protein [Candidatus Latescibacterota bacterium]